jgi:hypothetical protein
MDTDLENRISALETRSSRFRLASEGADGFHNYFQNLLLEERDFVESLLTHVIAGLHRDILGEVRALLDQALAQRIKGTHNPRDEYRIGDLVAKDGASFVARKDAPGACPGPDWQLVARQGQRGIAGPRGERGHDAPVIRSWELNREQYTAIPIMSDGTKGPTLELRALFEDNATG